MMQTMQKNDEFDTGHLHSAVYFLNCGYAVIHWRNRYFCTIATSAQTLSTCPTAQL